MTCVSGDLCHEAVAETEGRAAAVLIEGGGNDVFVLQRELLVVQKHLSTARMLFTDVLRNSFVHLLDAAASRRIVGEQGAMDVLA